MNMKRLSITLLAMTFLMASCNANDIPVKLSDIPKKAQAFITEHFAGYEVAYVMQDNDIAGTEYEVKFTNGDEVSFDEDGEWENIDCEFSEVPSSVVPMKILEYVGANFSKMKITSLEKGNRYEVELNNDLDLLFNLKFEFIKIDD